METVITSGSNKKRKTCREEDEELQDDDETKMEAFFALVRNIRETRDRWISLRSGQRERVSLGKEESKNTVAVWNPTFQLEDFVQEGTQNHQCKKRDPGEALLGGASQTNNCDKAEDADKGIDLRLSL